VIVGHAGIAKENPAVVNIQPASPPLDVRYFVQQVPTCRSSNKQHAFPDWIHLQSLPIFSRCIGETFKMVTNTCKIAPETNWRWNLKVPFLVYSDSPPRAPLNKLWQFLTFQVRLDSQMPLSSASRGLPNGPASPGV
jgi:hypothetical protein